MRTSMKSIDDKCGKFCIKICNYGLYITDLRIMEGEQSYHKQGCEEKDKYTIIC